MKSIGYLIIAIGLSLAFFTTFLSINGGGIHIRIHPLIWASLLGLMLALTGVVISVVGRRNSAKLNTINNSNTDEGQSHIF